MPHISVMLYPGRSEEQKQNMAEILRTSLMEAGSWKASDISVSFESIEADKFLDVVAEKVDREDLILTSDYVY